MSFSGGQNGNGDILGKDVKVTCKTGHQNEFIFFSARELHPDGAETLSCWFAMLISSRQLLHLAPQSSSSRGREDFISLLFSK